MSQRHREAGVAELCGAQRRGAARDDDRPTVGGQAPGELARRALGLAGDAAGHEERHVGLSGIADRSTAVTDKARQHGFAVGLAHLAAGEGGVDAQWRVHAAFALAPGSAGTRLSVDRHDPGAAGRLGTPSAAFSGVSSTTQCHSPSASERRRW